MKTYIIELNVAPKFQQAELIKVGKVEGAKSKKEALEAFRFYLKSSLAPVGKTVEIFGQITYTWDAPLSAYKA